MAANLPVHDTDEALDSVPLCDRHAYPLLSTVVFRTIAGVPEMALVEDVVVGRLSKEKLYRLRYPDGDVEDVKIDELESLPTTLSRWRSTTCEN